ncbi:glutamyl-tRNA reductase [Alsobacter soli]|uniref:Glutamyl-tRNA reductase n=1 Tax=Alsobacter soli TaxID=2109933 RepID=A0A2T1HU97_9HYPH|nr:DUF6468 domain-containing protein [Alsobacter soli]PSC05236.1 glutamyl-tRNA reductase [Alsobacter soli]
MIGLLIDLLVCVLLAATIAYCIMLDRRLRRFKADEGAMRRTIMDLMTATENAERAVAGLRAVVNDCDKSIAEHLRVAEQQSADLAGQIRSGDDVIARIARIVESARGGDAFARPAAASQPAVAPQPAPVAQGPQHRLAATLAAAEAFAERAHRRVNGRAA